jgi:hypothetical protein
VLISPFENSNIDSLCDFASLALKLLTHLRGTLPSFALTSRSAVPIPIDRPCTPVDTPRFPGEG